MAVKLVRHQVDIIVTRNPVNWDVTFEVGDPVAVDDVELGIFMAGQAVFGNELIQIVAHTPEFALALADELLAKENELRRKLLADTVRKMGGRAS